MAGNAKEERMDRNVFREMYAQAEPTVDPEWRAKVIDDSLSSLPENIAGTANLVIAVEECSELAQEVTRWIRGKGDRTGILEEIADVELAIDYVKKICGVRDDEIGKAINAKLARLDARNAGKCS
jgi:NTP pyrophosphatase (non-canonical NTP hydrolase)